MSYKQHLTSALLDRKKQAGWYGIEWDITNSSTSRTRIASDMTLHATLPIHAKMKRCLLTDLGSVTYLGANNSNYLADGITPSDLSGASGQFMVQLPRFYLKTESVGNTRRLKISESNIDGTWKLIKESYYSVAEASLHWPSLTLSSVVNDSPNYRGGDNNAAWDLQENSLLGKPVTNLSRSAFRTYAKNRGAGWIDLAYHVKNIITILYMIEYANTNIQLPYNSALSPEGYKQGGLGAGVTDGVAANWSAFSSFNPFIPCGFTADMGNNSGIKALTISDFGGSPYATYVPSYRGIQNFFGHIWQNADGILIKINSVAEGDTSEVYVTENWADFNDTDISVMDYVGNLVRSSGYIKDVILGEGDHFLPSLVGGGSTTYYADFFYTLIPSSGFSLRTLLLGAGAYFGARAGASYALSHRVPSTALANFGSRLCFLT